MKRKDTKKSSYLLLLFVILLGTTLGYGFLSTPLKIKGTTDISATRWNVYWNNVTPASNNTSDVITPATISTDKTQVEFHVRLNKPGDTYEFTVDAVNDGSIHAMIGMTSSGIYQSDGVTATTLPSYLEYSVTYDDRGTIQNKQLLEAGEREKIKVKVTYKRDITASQLPTQDIDYVFKYQISYIQADDTAISRT